MPVSKAQQKSVHKYVKNNYDRLEITVPKGQKDIIKKVASDTGKTLNSYVNEAITEKIQRDEEGTPQ